MIRQISILVFAMFAFLIACNKSDEVNPTNVDTSNAIATTEDIANVQYLEEEVDLEVEEITDTRDPGDCPEITSLLPKGEFPNTITIDFGDSCVRRNDHVFSGIIIVEVTGPKNEAGSVRTITYDGFAIDGILHTGSRTITITGVDDEGNVTLTKDVDIQLEFPNGQTATWISSRTMQQTEGGSTPYRYDDSWIITGSTEGVNRNGDNFTAEITEQLVVSSACRWLISGIITTEVTVENEVQTHSINFGYPSGDCDNLALVTLSNGDEKVIRVRRRWW